MKPYVIASDPPNGYAFWNADGPVVVDGVILAGQAPTGPSDAQRTWLVMRIIEGIKEMGYDPALICVEYPFGLANGGLNKVKALISQADSGGYIECYLSQLCEDAMMLRPMANEWRSRIGINGKDRAKSKAMAIKLARAVVLAFTGQRFAGIRGGVIEHACESVCMAMAAWLMCVMDQQKKGLPVDVKQDKLYKWFHTGQVARDANADGGQDVPASGEGEAGNVGGVHSTAEG